MLILWNFGRGYSSAKAKGGRCEGGGGSTGTPMVKIFSHQKKFGECELLRLV